MIDALGVVARQSLFDPFADTFTEEIQEGHYEENAQQHCAELVPTIG
jgi:hypothetical protein